MSKIPTFLSSWRAMLLHTLALPIFFLVFILFYESEWMITFLESDSNKVVFNALMLFSILIGVVSISRSIMIGAHSRLCVSWWQYTVWCLIEMIIFSCFAALYMALMHGIPSLKMGVGESSRSHGADEFVLESEIVEGIQLYIKFLKELNFEN